MRDALPRLVDDPAVSSALREDLARAGEQHRAYAAAYDSASKAAAFQAALASQGGSSVLGGSIAKAVIGTAGAAALMLAGAALHAGLSAQRAPAPAHDAAPVVVAAPVAPAAPVETVLPEPARRSVEIPPKAAEVAAPAAAPVPPAERRGERDGASRELRQLEQVRAYLKAGDAARALQLAQRGHRELGESALWQEREALAVLALLELARTEEADRRGAVLLERFPNSPFRAEIEHRLRRADAR